MAITEADICNVALARIGQKEPIASLDDNTTQAKLCKVLYAPSRNTVLAHAPWPFATKHATLGQLSYVRSGWQYAYALPADCVAPRYIFSGIRPGASMTPMSASVADPTVSAWSGLPLIGMSRRVPFSIEAASDGNSQILVTDWTPAELVYTALITTPVVFPPLFVDALEWLLASELALAIPVKSALEEQARKRFEVSVANALAASWRGEQEDPQPDSEFIAVRG